MEATEKNLPFAITLNVGSSLANKTGSWRTERAQYVDRLPPCNHACPAGENCQAWLYEAEDGGEGYERAWRKIVEDNPFPAIMGRVCYHPCETSCNRGELDEAVGIHSVERFIGDEAIKQGWSFDPPAESTGKRVLVVGAGPSGLSAAYHLRRLGHEVTIYEAGPMAGGMMRFGIPTYRLPRDVLDAEVDRILAMGVELELNRKVTNIEEAMTEGGFDAAFLAVGAHIGKHADIPAGEAARILDAVSMLESMESDEKPLLGRKVVVYGGGNTAMDAARTAKRLGATDAVVVYRRNRDRMPAHEFEVAEAEEEGVMMRWLETIKQVDGNKITIEKMELDETGFPQPTGEFDELEADSVILALGQEADLSLLEGVSGIQVEDGVVQVGPNMETGHRGVFAGGDMVPAERTVTVGVGHGKKAARNIDGWLRSRGYEPATEARGHHLRAAQHLVLRRRTEGPAARARDRAPALDLRRGGRRARRVECHVRGPPLHVVRQLLQLRQLLRRLPRQRGPEAGRGGGEPERQWLRDRSRLLQGLRPLRPGMPLRSDRDGPREDLTSGDEMAMRQAFERFRVAFWVFSAGHDRPLPVRTGLGRILPPPARRAQRRLHRPARPLRLPRGPPADGAAQPSARGRPHRQGAPRVLMIYG